MDHVQYSIKAVAQRTGLTPHVIRVWERRYGAVEPGRTGTNRRLYSGEEIQRLALLRQAIAVGHRIGNIARLSSEQLESLVGEASLSTATVLHRGQAHDADVARYIEEGLEAVRRMDADRFDAVLRQALIVLGHQGLLRRVVAPLAQKLGELWQEGILSAAHEHHASAALRQFLFKTARPFVHGESGPCLVVTTPTGQLHELGAVMISSAAINVGWRVAYLGVSLPAAEIAGAARQRQASVVALSIVYPTDDPGLPGELLRLREYLGSEVRLIVGGRAAPAYLDAIEKAGGVLMVDLGEFYRLLDDVRTNRLQPNPT